MRKFTLLIASLFLSLGAMAQITAVDQLSNDKCYQIRSIDAARGVFYAASNAEYLSTCAGTYANYPNQNVAKDESDKTQQFALLSKNGKFYLYSVSEKKFARRTSDGWIKLDLLPSDYVTVEISGGILNIKMNGTDKLNLAWPNNAVAGVNANYNTADDGNKLVITEVGDFDPAEALSLFDFSTPVAGKFYCIKGLNETSPWLTANTGTANAIVVSGNAFDAAVFLRTQNGGLQSVSTGKYFGLNGDVISLVNTEATVTLEAGSNSMYAIKVGGKYLHNNATDITHEGGLTATSQNYFGFIEVSYRDAYNNRIFALDSYMDYIYCLTDVNNRNIYTNGQFTGVADTRALWKFELAEIGVYNIKNVHTGLYIGATQHNSSVQMNETPGNYEIATAVGSETAQNGKHYIKVAGVDACLHSTAATAKGWQGGGEGNQYVFTEVTDFSHVLTVGSAEWATLVLGFTATIPTNEGFKAYIVEAIEGTTVKLAEATGVLAANTPIIVNAPQGDYTFAYTTDEATVAANGLLNGTLYNKNINEEAYVLGIPDGETEAVLGKAGMSNGSWLNNANKAYLPASALPAALQGVASFSFRYEGTTSIEEVETENAVKAIYDLTGRKVNEITAPGIYIVNGVKRVVR